MIEPLPDSFLNIVAMHGETDTAIIGRKLNEVIAWANEIQTEIPDIVEFRKTLDNLRDDVAEAREKS
jgi:hypothetical protein